MENRIRVFHGVVPGMVAKGALVPFFSRRHVTFQHDLCLGRHQEVVGLGLN